MTGMRPGEALALSWADLDGGRIRIQRNLVRHADGRWELSVVDDGPGFDRATILPGHGLALVRDRLAMTLGGDATLDVESAPGCTRVVISIPATPGSRTPNPEARIP